MAKFCIASPHKDESWYDYRLYVNIKKALESLGHIHQAGANNRIYFLGGPLKKHYPKVGQFDHQANNIALIYCHFQKIHNLRQFDRVFVPSDGVKRYFRQKKWQDRLRFVSKGPFATRKKIDIIRPFSSLAPTSTRMPRFECDIAFMGVPRVRPIVESVMKIVEKHSLNFKIIGPAWSKYPGHQGAAKHNVASSIAYEHMPAFAASAKIHLVDHHASMKRFAAVSHKYVDLIQSGAFVICDDNPDAENFYQGEVYRDDSELESLILHYLHNEEARHNKAAQQREICQYQKTETAAQALAACFTE